MKHHSLKEIYELATARVWIDNSRIPLYCAKRKEQIYIETWHDCIGVKKVGSAAQTTDFIGRKRVEYDTKLTDLMVSNSLFTNRLYREDFVYKGEILRCGSPRVDILTTLPEKELSRIRKKLEISNNKNIVLYAPTFRDNGRCDVYDVDFEGVCDALEYKFGGKWIVLIKLHPTMTKMQNIFNYSEKVINCSDYRDIYELMSSSKVLITDYSSVLFEMGLIYRPVFLYTKDIDEMAKSRGLYFKLKDLPFAFAENNNKLIDNIKSFSKEDYSNNIDLFNNNYLGATEPGNASKVVSSYILKKVNEYGKNKNW